MPSSLPDSRRSYYFRCPLEREKDVVFINTERVTEYGGMKRQAYEEGRSSGQERPDVKLDMELAKAGQEDIAWKREEERRHARGKEEVRPARSQSDRHVPVLRSRARYDRAPPDQPAHTAAMLVPVGTIRDEKIVNQKNKDAADVMTWREYEALRNEMQREFRVQDEELKETIDGVSKKLDTTNETVNAMQDQMTDIQRNIQALTLAVENLTQQQQHLRMKMLSFKMKHLVLVVVLTCWVKLVLGRATGAGIARGGEEQLDKKLDVKLDMELAMKLDKKTSHGSAREEREACARGEEEVSAMPG
ncbi:hypothetical protein QYE76_035438 [Lolium multiflorum]|uniref:Uncharacterized protein n=1 Tax=Lolium multiflorum TaxID=4521 RepID=A0AAD8VNZ9_LOLMU|nr:hypothetical protein QYE76_035438 [Lolium multiflorum]